jgi:hypothetical protein
MSLARVWLRRHRTIVRAATPIEQSNHRRNIGRSSDVTTVVLDDATAVWGYTAELLAFMCKNV